MVLSSSIFWWNIFSFGNITDSIFIDNQIFLVGCISFGLYIANVCLFFVLHKGRERNLEVRKKIEAILDASIGEYCNSRTLCSST